MNNALYFPYINIPNTNWLGQTLLYWDKIGSIIPMDHTENPRKLNKHMRDLVREGLVEQIFPGQYIGEIPNFKEAFIEFLDNDAAIQKKLTISKQEPKFRMMRVHLEKLDGLERDMEERGLAKLDIYPWYFVEAYTAYSFMTYLGVELSKVLSYRLITDKAGGVGGFSEHPRFDNLAGRINLNRTQILRNILPVPVKYNDLYDVIKFKNRHQDELSRFRNYIEAFILEIEALPSELRQQRIEIFLEDAEDDIKSLESKMRYSFGLADCLTLCSIGAASINIGKGLCTSDISDLISGSVGVTVAALGAINRIGKSELNDNHLAYALLARNI